MDGCQQAWINQLADANMSWAKLRHYRDISDIGQIWTEEDKIVERYFLQKDAKQATNIVQENISCIMLVRST